MGFLNNNGNNGGGNPNHDESGKFSSQPGNGGGGNAPAQNPDDALIDRSLANLIKHAKSIGVENPTPNQQWGDELGYQLMNDGVPPEKVGPLLDRFQARMKEQKMRSMGFSEDGGAGEQPQAEQRPDTEAYANMVLDERRTIPHYGQPGKDWDSLRKKRVEMLRNEPNEKLEQIRSEVNGIAKKWSMANRNRGITNDELMALKSLFVDVNNELSRRRG